MSWFWDKKVVPPVAPPARMDAPQQPRWSTNFTDRLIEVTATLGSSGAEVVTKYTPDQARSFARNLVLLADNLDALYPPEAKP